ncbi:helix-turn-helix domain-containing protein [Bacillus benzoevorans]|uniref:Transcriptional regulator with XRE-family HTH domain n=1 Tax=Bacillus benzoevorans TaxID=1456 RepID=A0A7X0HR71_9BACI|nr:helix-turn-helix transcriptional regulator [Bacillus benzoevorans]MBB6445399.1 transcriptional regulator with XRE-family HTH domain [Bacillus benzoevorans]
MYIIKPRLGAILKEKGWTQTALADKANVPQSAISRFDKNEQHKDVHLFAISRALGLTIEELFIIEEIDAEE